MYSPGSILRSSLRRNYIHNGIASLSPMESDFTLSIGVSGDRDYRCAMTCQLRCSPTPRGADTAHLGG